MLQRDKKKIYEKKRQEYLEVLKKPRSKEYLRYFFKRTELEQEICKIEQQIQELSKEISREITKDDSIEEIWSTENVKIAKEEENIQESFGENNIKERKWWEMEPNTYKKEEKNSWLNENVSGKEDRKRKMEKLERKQQLQNQRERLVEEWKEASRQFEQQMPDINALGMVYNGLFTGLLKKWGIISISGESYRTPQELLNLVNPETEVVAERWINGDKIFQRGGAILVEIYMDVFCRIDSQGNVELVEE